jgi:hypothetical protein
MPNPIKYSTGTETLALKKGNFYIGTGDVGKGPSDVTGYYQGPSPASGGYVIYLNKSGVPGNLSYHSAANDSQLISFTNNLSGTSFTSATQCLVYYAGQTDKVCLNIDYEGIVTSGLILNLDAGFTPSYSRSGTTWYNLNGSINGSLTNGPTFNSDYGGNVIFDGVNDYITTTFKTQDHFTNGQSFTISSFFKLRTSTYAKGFMGTQNFQSVPNSGGFGVMFFPTNKMGIFLTKSNGNGTQTTYQGICPIDYLLNQWWNYTITFSDGTLTAYSNAVVGNTDYSSSYTWSTSAINMLISASTQGGWGSYIPMDLGTFSIYNRALSAAEVLQNYNAQKGRFGL